MARERRRLLISPERLAGEVTLSAAEAHYLTRVLRLSQGQGCDVVDGAGRRWGALLAGGDRLVLEQPLARPLEQVPPGMPPLVLGVALPRQDSELIWRMATELGIDQLQPLVADRCSGRTRWPEDRWPRERWQAILREASEQCERLWLPELHAPRSAAGWFSGAARGIRLLASSRGEHLPHLLDLLPGLLPRSGEPCGGPGASRGPAAVLVAIGPEGGWSPEEEATALGEGWIAFTAGATILRTSTAAVTAAAWMAGWRARVSSSSGRGQSP